MLLAQILGQVSTHRSAMCWRGGHVLELLEAGLVVPGAVVVHGQVHDVGDGPRLAPPPRHAPAPAGSRGAVLGPHELVVVQLVAAGAGVALVLGHGVGHALVHVDVHLGAEHRHVVT